MHKQFAILSYFFKFKVNPNRTNNNLPSFWPNASQDQAGKVPNRVATQQSSRQFFPFHLVDPSPWPILLSFSLLNLTIGAVAYMHGFSYGGYILTLGFILTTYGMILWFRDVIIEGTALSLFISQTQNIFSNHIYFISKTIPPEKIEQTLMNFTTENKGYLNLNKDQFSYYFSHPIPSQSQFQLELGLGGNGTGLLEGDGHLSLPALGKTSLNRILNPRIIFTSHINNMGLYAYIQS
jgi:hypothetical protein